jgi:hypothetical protein
VVLHHGEYASTTHMLEKSARNLATSAVHVLEPNAQPSWLQPATRATGLWLAKKFPAEPDPFVFMAMPRRAQLEMLMGRTEPDADIVGCGLLAAGLFAAGLLAGFTTRAQPGAAQVRVWGVGVLVYLVTQHALVQWHPWAFRFMVLASPWMAAIGIWGVARLRRVGRLVVLGLAMTIAAQVFVALQWRTKQAAWQALVNPDASGSYFSYSRWRAWARTLDHPSDPLRLAFPINQPLASFYRLAPPRTIRLERLATHDEATAEQAVGSAPGWIVVPLERFMGQEGRVMGRTNLLNAAAYRALLPGERPQPLLYGNRQIPKDDLVRQELVIRTWADAPVRLELVNSGPTEIRGRVRSPTGERSAVVPAHGRVVVEVPVPPEVIALVTVDFRRAAFASGEGVPLAQLMP